jgi:hypothetical protein
MARTRWQTIFAALALVGTAACAGKGCSCVAPIKGGFPVTERHESAIQLRATQSLFAYLSANGASLIPKLLPSGSTFNIPPSCSGSNKICCATPAPMCRLQMDFQTLNLSPQNGSTPATMQLTSTLKLKTLDDLPVDTALGHCVVAIDTTSSGAPTMSITSDVQFPINATTDNTEVKLTNTQVTGIDGSDLDFNRPGSDIQCILGNIPGINTFIVGQLESQVQTQIESMVSSQTCMTCMDKSDCNAFATDCVGGHCVGADGMTCIQSVGLEGRMDVGSLLAKFSPSTQAGLDVLAVLGGYAGASSGGLSLGMLGGGLPDPHSSCVPTVAPPPKPAVMPSPTFTTNTEPDGTTAYHLGIGVHRTHLDQVGWAAFDAGALCLDIGTPQVALLSAKTISVVIPSLSDLTHGSDAPMYLVMRPHAPPTFSLGKGTFKMDANGMKQIDDPLLDISVPDFAIDFYAYVDEHYVRVMTLTADLVIPVGIDVDDMGRLTPLLGDFTKAFTNVTVSNTELLSEAPGDLAKTFPMLLGLAGGQLSSVLKPIALPALMGLNVKPKLVTSTDPDSDGKPQFLSIFSDLSLATPLSIHIDTHASLAQTILPSTREFAVDARTGAEPQLDVDVSARAAGTEPSSPRASEGWVGQPTEYSWQLDGAGWSPWSPGPRLSLTHPLLWLQGHHRLDVHARIAGAPAPADPEVTTLDVDIDTIAPSVTLEPRADGRLRVIASDNVSPAATLVGRVRNVDGSVGPWTSLDALDIVAEDLQVDVRDEAGNVGTSDFHGRTTVPPSAGCGSCALGGASSPSGSGTVALVVALLGAIALRRRTRLLVALALAGVGLAGCNDGSVGKGDLVAPVDEVGRYHDVVAKGGVLQLSAYDDSVGDLVYARVTDPSQPIEWRYVDGIDPNAIVDMPGGYRHGVSDPGPDVGYYTSIALTAGGDPRISYQDLTNNAVKLALGPHFRTVTIESSSDPHVKLGLYTALTLDDHDVPSIAYLVTGLSDGAGGFKSELRLATATSASPNDGEFTIQVVDSTRVSCAGLCGAGQACIQMAMVNGMPNGDPAQSTCVATTSDCTATMCAATEACIQGTCTAFLAAPKAPDWVEGIGLFTRALRVGGVLELLYYDRAQGDLKLATRQADGSFQTLFVDGNDPSTDVGQFCTMVAADDGTLHIAYQDAIADRLLYKTVSGGAAMPTPEVIDDGVRPDGIHPVGEGVAIVLDGGNPRVVYQDLQLADLLEATRAGNWSHEALQEGPAGYGWYPHLVPDGDKVWLTQFVYDRANPDPPLGRLQISTLN